MLLRSAIRLASVAAVTLALVGCAGDGSDVEESVDLEFTRADGSVAPFPQDVRAWCGPFDENNGDVTAVHVLAGEREPGEDADPFWIVIAVRADVERDPETTLPNDFVYTEPRGASMFALDDAEHDRNELSSSSERSSGTIRVELAGCDEGDLVELGFEDATLGSEFGNAPAISVEGTAVVRIGDPP